MEWFTVELAIKMAITHAEQLRKKGRLIAMDMDYDWNQEGEAHTVNSLYNLYREFASPQNEDLIRKALFERYPDYF